MKYKECYMNLFDADREYALAHCVSEDFKMGAGVAKQFKERFPEMKECVIRKGYRVGDVAPYLSKNKQLILNLITKERFFHKPTYATFSKAIQNMKCFCERMGIEKIAMPLLGAGLDKLDWNVNKEIIKNIFKDTDIEILVCKIR